MPELSSGLGVFGGERLAQSLGDVPVVCCESQQWWAYIVGLCPILKPTLSRSLWVERTVLWLVLCGSLW